MAGREEHGEKGWKGEMGLFVFRPQWPKSMEEREGDREEVREEGGAAAE